MRETRAWSSALMRSPPTLVRRRNSRSSSYWRSLAAKSSRARCSDASSCASTARQLRAQHLDLGLALERLEARVDEVDAVVDGLQLRGLVHHVHGRGDLPAIVQQPRDLELVAVLVRHAELPRAGPAVASLAASASIIVSVGTRLQCPPV